MARRKINDIKRVESFGKKLHKTAKPLITFFEGDDLCKEDYDEMVVLAIASSYYIGWRETIPKFHISKNLLRPLITHKHFDRDTLELLLGHTTPSRCGETQARDIRRDLLRFQKDLVKSTYSWEEFNSRRCTSVASGYAYKHRLEKSEWDKKVKGSCTYKRTTELRKDLLNAFTEVREYIESDDGCALSLLSNNASIQQLATHLMQKKKEEKKIEKIEEAGSLGQYLANERKEKVDFKSLLSKLKEKKA